MQNYIQEGDVIEVTVAADIESGAGIKLGSLIGVTLGKALNGETARVKLNGVFELPKATGALTVGALVYWDDTAKNVTTTSSGNTLMGKAFAAAASGDTTGIVRLTN